LWLKKKVVRGRRLCDARAHNSSTTVGFEYRTSGDVSHIFLFFFLPKESTALSSVGYDCQ
jgi:hypothetical protein